MNPSNTPNDPILEALVEDAERLARAAAIEARTQAHARKMQMRFVMPILILLPALSFWILKPAGRREIADQHASRSSNVAANSTSVSFVKVSPEKALSGKGPDVPGANGREKELLTELSGLPVLVVRNQAGQVTRVHVFDR